MSTETHGATPPTTSTLTAANRWDHALARLGYRRGERRTEPGLYALGAPGPQSPVFVTANYRLSYDALRGALGGVDGYILVLDTDGINVWCAAGKGTFGTEELVQRIAATGLASVVAQRTLILPQLGAAGVSAHEVRRRSGFRVEYGPVRAEDLPAYLRNHRATPEMRRVRFDLRDRLLVMPMELMHVLPFLLLGALAVGLLRGTLAAAGLGAAMLAGTALFPILLPWLPTHEFSTKGFFLGGIVAAAFAAAHLWGPAPASLWQRGLAALVDLLCFAPITAFLALNFTGSTTFTSRTGVKREIAAYVPWMAGLFAVGLLLTLAWPLIRTLGGR